MELFSNCKHHLQEEVVLAVQRMQVLLGLYMMLSPGALLLTITTCQQTRRHFFWSFLISLSGQMFIFKTMPGLLCRYFGVVSRLVKFRCIIYTGRALVPMHGLLLLSGQLLCTHFFFGSLNLKTFCVTSLSI